MQNNNSGFSTKTIHGGNVRDTQYGSLIMPIYQNATFCFDNCEQGGRRFAGLESGYVYSRAGNPTTTVLENRVALLENAESAVAFSSGMGAISSVLWTICAHGKHVIADNTLYGCSFALLAHGLTRYGVEVTFADLSDISQLQAELRGNTVAVFFETPANPNLKVVDIAAVAKMAHDHNEDIKVIVDSTFATPYLTRPLDLGADVVVHSATKYLNGHGDVIAGIACGKTDFMTELRVFGLKNATGAVLGPHEAFLILRGLKTLELRMERHCSNALALTEFLSGHPMVERVYFPGLPGHPNHEVARRQMRLFGGMAAFEICGGRAAGAKLLDNLQLCTLAVSLGDAETLVEHPASMTHSTYTAEELKEAYIAEGLVRVSVGLETIDDIIADFEQAFSKM